MMLYAEMGLQCTFMHTYMLYLHMNRYALSTVVSFTWSMDVHMMHCCLHVKTDPCMSYHCYAPCHEPGMACAALGSLFRPYLTNSRQRIPPCLSSSREWLILSRGVERTKSAATNLSPNRINTGRAYSRQQHHTIVPLMPCLV